MVSWRDRVVEASALVALLGLAFVLAGVGLWVTALFPQASTPSEALFELVMHVLFGGVILGLGIHVERSELHPEERFSVLVWSYGGFSLMFVLSVWGHLGALLAGQATLAFASDFVVLTSLGGAFGVIAGVNRGRATRNRLLAERNEDQRETLALLTRLLSHDIRNDLSLMLGHAEMLEGSVDEAGADRLEVIQRRMNEMATLLEAASTLVKSFDEERAFEPVDVSALLLEAATALAQDHRAVDVETDVDPGLAVEADALLDQLFTNLLQNAVNHNDPADLTVRVMAERDDEEVAVVVEDDGRGVPEEVRESLFDLGQQGPDSDGDGIGLYLVSRLAALYGGSVSVDDAPGGGARFEVRLPAVGAEA